MCSSAPKCPDIRIVVDHHHSRHLDRSEQSFKRDIIYFDRNRPVFDDLQEDLTGCLEDAEIILGEMRELSAGFDRARVPLSELIVLQSQHSTDHNASLNSRENALYAIHLETLARETSSLPALRRLQNEVEEVFEEWMTLARQARHFYETSLPQLTLQTSEMMKMQSKSRALRQEAQTTFGAFMAAKDWFYELRHASQKPAEGKRKVSKKGDSWHFRPKPKDSTRP